MKNNHYLSLKRLRHKKSILYNNTVVKKKHTACNDCFLLFFRSKFTGESPKKFQNLLGKSLFYVLSGTFIVYFNLRCSISEKPLMQTFIVVNLIYWKQPLQKHMPLWSAETWIFCWRAFKDNRLNICILLLANLFPIPNTHLTCRIWLLSSPILAAFFDGKTVVLRRGQKFINWVFWLKIVIIFSRCDKNLNS